MRKYIYLLFILTIVFSSCETEEPIPTYTLSTSISPTEGGIMTVSPQSPNYQEGEVVTLTPEANEHWVFEKWEGDASGSTTPLQITMNSDKSVTGAFIKRNYQLTITIEGEGTVEESIITNPSGREYPHGTTVELTPIPEEGWIFESWGGNLTGSDNPQAITVDKEMNVTARFIRRNYLLTTTIEGEGTISIDPDAVDGNYVAGTEVTLTASPATGWVFSGWGENASGGTTPLSVNMTSDMNIIATFDPISNNVDNVTNVTNPATNRIWMDRNLGARQVATSSTDADAYGDYYQWGRGTDGHEKQNSSQRASSGNTDQPDHGDFIISLGQHYDWRRPQNNDLWQGVNGTNNPCPSGYRLPTEAELEAERASWDSNDAEGALASPLRLPMGGSRMPNGGNIGGVGSSGEYWSSTVSSISVRSLNFWRDGAVMASYPRGYGMSVRCVKD